MEGQSRDNEVSLEAFSTIQKAFWDPKDQGV